MIKEIFAVICGVISASNIYVWFYTEDYPIWRLVMSIVMNITAIPMEIYQVYYSPFYDWIGGIISIIICVVNFFLGIVGIVLASKDIKFDREIARAKENEVLAINIEELRGKLSETEQEIAELKGKQSAIMDKFNNFEGEN